MSELIMSLCTSAFTRLEAKINEYDSVNMNIDMTQSAAQIKTQTNNLIVKLECIKIGIETTAEEIKKLDQDAVKAIVARRTQEQETWQTKYNKYVEDNEMFTKLTAAYGIVDSITVELHKLEILKLTENNGTNHIEIANKAILPKITLPSFSGNVKEFNTYWASFNENVDKNNNLSKVTKLTYLLSTLEGKAKYAIQGLAITEANYELAISILKRRFGDQKLIKQIINREIQNLKPSGKEIKEIRIVFEKMENMIRQLEAMGDDMENPQIEILIEAKLPFWMLNELYERKERDPNWSVKKLRETIDKILINRESVSQIKPKFLNENINVKAITTNYENKTIENKEKRETKCAFCEKTNHISRECKTIKDRKERFDIIMKKRLCKKCLKPNHAIKECRAKLAYWQIDNNNQKTYEKGKVTKNANNTPKQQTKQTKQINAVTNDESNQNKIIDFVDVNINVLTNTKDEEILEEDEQKVLFGTMKIKARNIENKTQSEILAFLDSGSEISFISEELVKALKLKPFKREILNVCTFPNTKSQQISDKYKLGIKTRNNATIMVKMNSSKEISNKMKRVLETEKLDKNTIKVKEEQPHMLIGCDYFWDIIPVGKKVKSGFKIIETMFGDLVCGKGSVTVSTCLLDQNENNTALDKQLQNFWKLETIGIHENPEVTDDDQAIKLFKKGINKIGNKYEVGWPWKKNHKRLASNFGMAFGRLTSLCKKLKELPDGLQMYDTEVKKLLDLGFIEEVDKNDKNGLIYYMPHRAVITPQKTTTKVRLVFDASSKTGKNGSLNDCLYKGPDLMPELVGMLLRMREPKILITSDVEKAFHQIHLKENDRNANRLAIMQRILNLHKNTLIGYGIQPMKKQ